MPEPRTGLRPGPRPRTVRDADGAVLDVPPAWELLPPGDAAVTRGVKAMGPTWAIEEKRGRKVFSGGLWAPAENVRATREAVAEQRADPAHQRKLDAARRRRAEDQADYVQEFEAEVLRFLRFDPRHAAVAAALAARVTAHATPVGSGTVARTERIPVEKRAEAAVIAWMRHQTTAYDDMSVAPVKGARRELRRALADRSRAVLTRYRRGDDADPACPLARALREPARAPTGPVPAPTQAPAPPVPGSRPGPPAIARDPASAPPAAPPARDAHDEAQRALYLKVRERLTRGR